MTRYRIHDGPHRWTTTSTHEAASAARNGARVTAVTSAE